MSTREQEAIAGVWSRYSDQQLVDVVDAFEVGHIKLVYVAERAKLSPDASNWLNDVNKVMLGALRAEVARRRA